MEDSKSVVASGAYGIPKWIMKKGMRYEVDDFIVSPPSLDDGGFLRLRYGHSCAHTSPQQGAGQEGGMTVEVKDDTLQFSCDPTPTTTTISIGPGGLSVEPSPITTPETKSESPDVHPLLVLPMKFGDPKFVLKVQTSRSSKTNKDSLGPTATETQEPVPPVIQEPVKPTTSNTLENLKTHNTTTLVDKVWALSVTKSPEESVGSTPAASPLTTPRTSPILSRRILGVTMDPPRKISAHSYFCTKQYKADLGGNNYKQDILTSVHPKQLEEQDIPKHALDPKMMGQRRRQPKPSTLREMNFWAPTSM